MSGPLLGASGLSVERGSQTLLGGLDFSLAAGEVVEVAGPNGCGKTTLLRTLAGLQVPDAGEVRWCGTPIGEARSAYAADLAWLGHANGVKADLTALEHLELTAEACGSGPQQAARALVRVDLRTEADVPAGRLSAGQRRRLALGRLLVQPARIWLLDEPFTALDARSVLIAAGLIAERAATGGAVVYSSHQHVPIAGCRRLDLADPAGG